MWRSHVQEVIYVTSLYLAVIYTDYYKIPQVSHYMEAAMFYNEQMT